MTEPNDIEKGRAATSRRGFLREGGALMGGAVIVGGLAGRQALAATEPADNLPPNPGVDENAWRSNGKPAVRDAFAFRESRRQEYPEYSSAIFVGIGTD